MKFFLKFKRLNDIYLFNGLVHFTSHTLIRMHFFYDKKLFFKFAEMKCKIFHKSHATLFALLRYWYTLLIIAESRLL